LGEFVLVLTYQRGGWISYPITLLFIWIAIYVVRCLENNNLEILGALRKSIIKVIISLPITIVATLLIISYLNKSQDSSISQYIERFKNIKQTSDRTNFIVAGYLIGVQHPFYGAASDSFAYEYEREFEEASGNHFKLFNLPLHGTAHNAYAQTIAGKGLVGLVTLLGILASMVVAIKFAVIKSELDIKERVTILMCACFAIAFLVYANVQEVFYMHSLQVLFFIVISILSAQIPFANYEVSGRQLQLFIKIIAITFISHIVWEYLTPAKVKRFHISKNDVGCYKPETDISNPYLKLNYRWCRKNAYQEFEVMKNDNQQTGILLNIATSNLLNKPLEIKLGSEYFDNKSLIINPGEEIKHFIQIDKNLNEKIPVQISADRAFVPFVVDRASSDLRSISFKLMEANN
jgi:hypothetical protein